MSTTTTGLPPSAEVYLAALRDELADLAAEEREDLLSEVEPSLLEAAADGDDAIAARLGPPADFAADLRASAGLPPAPSGAAARPRAGLAELIQRLADHEAVTRAAAVGREFAPLWWVARAYVAVATLALVTGQGAGDVAFFSRYPELPRLGSHELGVLVLAAAVAGSVALGIAARRRPRRRHGALIALNAALVLCALPVAVELGDAFGARTTPAAAPSEVQPASEPVAGLALDGAPVRNVYPYDRKGRLLHDVRLYGAGGKPLEIGRDAIDPDRRAVSGRDGERVFNAFPIRYYEPGTTRVARPEAAPPRLEPGRITTPPLGR